MLGAAGALAVAIVSGSLAVRLERRKQRAILEAQAVVDVGRAIAMTAIASDPGDREAAMVLFADAKVRLAAYGSSDAARAIAAFIDAGASTSDPDGRDALMHMVQAVRRRTLPLRGRRLDARTVESLLFGPAVPGLGGIDSWEFTAAVRVRANVAVPPASTEPGALQAPTGGSNASPIAASFGQIEDRLRTLLMNSGIGGIPTSGDQMAGVAFENGLIESKTAIAIGGLEVMLDLALNAPPDTWVDQQRAAEYAAMVAGVLYAIDPHAASRQQQSATTT